MTTYLSPMQRHQVKVAQLSDNKSTLIDAPSSLHILKAELDRDIDYLKVLPCIEDKVNYKRDTLLPKWLPKVEHYLKEGCVYQNSIFVYCIVWLFDTEDFEKGLELAEIATDQNQTTPANWSMTIPGFVCKKMLDWSEDTAANGHSVEPYFSQVFNLINTKWRIYESDRAAWYKFAGLSLLRDESGQPRATAIEDIKILEQAHGLLTQAHNYHHKIGVKTMIGSIDARINALTK